MDNYDVVSETVRDMIDQIELPYVCDFIFRDVVSRKRVSFSDKAEMLIIPNRETLTGYKQKMWWSKVEIQRNRQWAQIETFNKYRIWRLTNEDVTDSYKTYYNKYWCEYDVEHIDEFSESESDINTLRKRMIFARYESLWFE